MRDHRRGIILLSTLMSVLLLASIAAMLQTRMTGNLVVMEKLERAYAEAPAETAIHERLRAILADALADQPIAGSGVNFRGDGFLMEQGGQKMIVEINDPDGLVDVYLSSPRILQLLPNELRMDEGSRQKMLRGLPPGTRLPSLPSSLARLNYDLSERTILRHFVTQASESGLLRMENVPEQLLERAATLSGLETSGAAVSNIRIKISPGS